jgi:hypothetical protein
VDQKKIKRLKVKIILAPLVVIFYSVAEKFLFSKTYNIFLMIFVNIFFFLLYFQLSFYVFLLWNLLYRLEFLLLKVQKGSKIDVEILHTLLELSFETLREIDCGFSINILLAFGEKNHETSRKL